MLMGQVVHRCIGNIVSKPTVAKGLSRLLPENCLWDLLNAKYRSEYFPILLDYPVNSVARYGYGRPAHSGLYSIISENRDIYESFLRSFSDLTEQLLSISTNPDDARPTEPCWESEWMTGLDGVAIYGFLARGNPRRYLEVGSGNSTRFARRAIHDHYLRTSITSIDPMPRAEIDSICDRTLRKPLEEADLSVFEELEAGDVVFMDGSHRSFMNSDATVFFLDVLPTLKPGVIAAVHDIYLPYDYKPDWRNRYYSEQYLLATSLLAGHRTFDVIFPTNFIANEPDLCGILDRFWRRGGVEQVGSSFWIEVR